jgi:hypothetical protein
VVRHSRAHESHSPTTGIYFLIKADRESGYSRFINASACDEQIFAREKPFTSLCVQIKELIAAACMAQIVSICRKCLHRPTLTVFATFAFVVLVFHNRFGLQPADNRRSGVEPSDNGYELLAERNRSTSP